MTPPNKIKVILLLLLFKMSCIGQTNNYILQEFIEVVDTIEVGRTISAKMDTPQNINTNPISILIFGNTLSSESNWSVLNETDFIYTTTAGYELDRVEINLDVNTVGNGVRSNQFLWIENIVTGQRITHSQTAYNRASSGHNESGHNPSNVDSTPTNNPTYRVFSQRSGNSTTIMNTIPDQTKVSFTAYERKIITYAQRKQ